MGAYHTASLLLDVGRVCAVFVRKRILENVLCDRDVLDEILFFICLKGHLVHLMGKVHND